MLIRKPNRALAIIFLAIGLCAPGSQAQALPAYSIVSESPAGDGVRVSVRLDARQTAADLKAIADDVRRRLPAAKTVRSVAFFLPSAPLDGNAWADAKIADQTSVTINGLRLDEEDAYRAEASADTRKRIGVWLTSPPALAGRLTLYRDAKGKTFAEWQLRSGQKTTDEVFESRSKGGRRFDIAGGDGGYYRLDGKGMLELGNARSVIAVAEPLKLEMSKIATTPAGVTAQQPVALQTVPVQKATADTSALPSVAPTIDGKAAAADAPAKAEPLAAKPVRKRAAERPHVGGRATRQADAAADAIQKALAQ